MTSAIAKPPFSNEKRVRRFRQHLCLPLCWKAIRIASASWTCGPSALPFRCGPEDGHLSGPSRTTHALPGDPTHVLPAGQGPDCDGYLGRDQDRRPLAFGDAGPGAQGGTARPVGCFTLPAGQARNWRAVLTTLDGRILAAARIAGSPGDRVSVPVPQAPAHSLSLAAPDRSGRRAEAVAHFKVKGTP